MNDCAFFALVCMHGVVTILSLLCRVQSGLASGVGEDLISRFEERGRSGALYKPYFLSENDGLIRV